MDDIWKVVAEFGIELHPDSIDAISSKIAVLKSHSDLKKAMVSFGTRVNQSLTDRLEEAWKKASNITPIELAAALRGSSRAATLIDEHESVELVWTGPDTELEASRHTEQVLLEVISMAKKSLFIVSFVAHDIDNVIKALHDAVLRNIKINILLESSDSYGGKVDTDSIKTFLLKVPSANIYAWNPDTKFSGKWSGAVHAKCAVADGDLAFITSANLTKAAMEKNMELGILVRGGRLPGKLDRHLESLITTGIIKRV